MARPKKATPAPKSVAPKPVDIELNGFAFITTLNRLTAALERSERIVGSDERDAYINQKFTDNAPAKYDGPTLTQAGIAKGSSTVPLETMIEEASGRLSKILEGSLFIKNRLVGEGNVNGCATSDAPFQSHGYSKDRLLAMFGMMDQIEFNLGAIQTYTLM